MRNRVIPLLLALLIVLPQQAVNAASLDWHTHNFPNSCLLPGLEQEGQANFDVNTIPIPTYSDWNSLRKWSNGAFEMDFHAPFSATLFRVGTNDIAAYFATANGADHCTHVDNEVRLRGPGVDRLLFQTTRNGTAYQGETEVALSLREIDPQLADSLQNLKAAIAEARDALHRTARTADELADGLERLAALDAAIDELLARGWDSLTPEDLDALLALYDDLLPGVRDALVQFLSDLQRDVAELRQEIERISEVFRQQADSVDGVLSGAPGWDPQDPGGFDPIATGEPPPIDVPAVLGTDPWSPANDPYADYADSVLASLASTVNNGTVEDRISFIGIYQAWRYNIDTLEVILQMRSAVSVGEWGAFLSAKTRVLSYLHQFIDDRGWMKDAPIPPAVRDFIDLLKDLDVTYRFKRRAEALQLELNTWRGELTDRQQAILDVLLVLDAHARERLAQEAPKEEDGFWDIVGDIIDTAIEFTPIGDLLDACRLVTGREGCWNGRELTWKERALSGLGVAIGSGAAWKAAAGKVSGGAAAAVRKVGEVLDEVRIRRPRANIVEEIRHAGGAVSYRHANGKIVRYSRRGFPDFSPHLYQGPYKNTVRIEYTGSRQADFRAAYRKAGFNKEADWPDGYTWHHSEDLSIAVDGSGAVTATGKMQLVRTDVHDDFAHTGGVALWQKMYDEDYRP